MKGSHIHAGRLDKRVTLQTPTETQDSTYGSVQQSWSNTATLWGAIEPLSGREWLQARQQADEISLRVTIRWRSDVTNKCRFAYGSRTFEIMAIIDHDEMNEFLVLMCRELVNG